MPKVSVIVPVYNVEKYIDRCLKTLVNQTLKDIEIIIVNDGSTDNSKEIINKYIEKFPQKIIYLEKENGGLSDARNYGIPYANSEYIGFIDSDDYVEKDMFEKMYNKAAQENSDMVECDFLWEYPNNKKIDTGKIYYDKKQAMIYARVVAWNKIIKSSIIKENNLIFPKGLRYEDVEFFYKSLPYLNKISFVKEPLVHYIQRQNSIVNTQNARTQEIFKIWENIFEYYKKKDLYNEYFQELEYTYTRFLLCSSLLRIVKIENKMERTQILEKTWNNLNSKFPDWKKNSILLKDKSKKNIYMRTVNKCTFKIYSTILKKMN